MRFESEALLLPGFPGKSDFRRLMEVWFGPWLGEITATDNGPRLQEASALDTLVDHWYERYGPVGVTGQRNLQAQIRLEKLGRANGGDPVLGAANFWPPETDDGETLSSVLIGQLIALANEFRSPLGFVSEYSQGEFVTGKPAAGFSGRQRLHMVSYRETSAPSMKPFGLFRGLSGVAWRTVFGPDLVNFVGQTSLEAIPSELAQQIGESTWLLSPSKDPADWTRNTWCDGEREIISILGTDKFFNPDTKELPTSWPTIPDVAPYPVVELDKIVFVGGKPLAAPMDADEIMAEQKRWFP